MISSMRHGVPYEASQGPSRPHSMAYYDTIAIVSSIYFVCFIKQCHYNVITFCIICANRVIQLHFGGTTQMYVWNQHICRVRGVPSKNYRQQPCCMHALASTPTSGMCGALCGRIFLGSKSSNQILVAQTSKENTSTLYWQFSREYSFLKEAPIYFSLFVHSITTLTQRSRAILG